MNKPLTSVEVDAERQTERVARVFADGEDTHTLHLASELADLRVGYANLIPQRKRYGARFDAIASQPKRNITQ